MLRREDIEENYFAPIWKYLKTTQKTRDSWQRVGPDTLINCREQLARQSAKELAHGNL
jgi:hypothetical protein